jgi:hypothetical protein
MKEKAVDRGHGSSGKVLASKFGAPSLIPSTHKKKKQEEEEEESTDTCNYMDESSREYAK